MLTFDFELRRDWRQVLGIAAVAGVLLLACLVAADATRRQHAANEAHRQFMSICIAHQTEVRCRALWRWNRQDLAVAQGGGL